MCYTVFSKGCMDMKNRTIEITSDGLHIIAMLLMLSDHLWASMFTSQNWMTCLGRMAFPIFAFMTVEGYFHTRNLKRYMKRLLIFAVLSEIPFNLLYSGVLIYPFHQNVLWTFLIALSGMWAMEIASEKLNRYLAICAKAAVVILCFLLATAAMTDFYGKGILIVFVFYFFRGRKWWCYAGQFLAMYWINVELFGGYYYPVTIFGKDFELIQQGFAMFSLVFIWLYRGKKGSFGKPFQLFCYSFYPVHCLILGILQKL